MHLQDIKQKAIGLRTAGYSYTYIKSITGISKSTLSDWLANIPYQPNRHTISVIGNARAASGRKKHLIKLETLDRATVQAANDIESISKRDLFMLGLAIYIGEGSKSNNIIRVVNADLRTIRLMIKWFQTICNASIDQMRIRLYLYPDNDEKKCIEYWSKNTRVPISQFHSSIIDMRGNKKAVKRGKLPFGTAHLSLVSMGRENFGVYLHSLILAWIERVLC